MTIPGNTVSGSGNDPLVGQLFMLDLQGAVTGYFTQCSGLSSSNEVITSKMVDHNTGRMRIRKIPGPITFENITLSKGITSSLELWKWIKAVADGEIKENRKDGTISLCDPVGMVVAQWTLVAAWPVRVSGPSLNTTGGQVGIEELELVIEGFTRTM